jgi:hypothetical protein
MLGVVRTLRSIGREITFLSRLMKILANDEIMAAVAAGDLGAMMQLMVPVIGVVTAGISIIAGARITAARAAIPVGQTSPGQFRGVQATGAAVVHAGEIIGRPALPTQPATVTAPGIATPVPSGMPMGFNFNFFDSNMSTKADMLDAANTLFADFYTKLTTYTAS